MSLQHIYLLQQVQELVLEGPLSAKELAKAIGKPYPTLMRELNPYDQGAKLGLETFLEILTATGNLKAFGALARGLGYCLVRQEQQEEPDMSEHALGHVDDTAGASSLHAML